MDTAVASMSGLFRVKSGDVVGGPFAVTIMDSFPCAGGSLTGNTFMTRVSVTQFGVGMASSQTS